MEPNETRCLDVKDGIDFKLIKRTAKNKFALDAHNEVRNMYLQNVENSILTASELDDLWLLLFGQLTDIEIGGSIMITYDEYLTIREKLGVRFEKILSASLFAKLLNGDHLNRISSNDLLDYVHKYNSLIETISFLSQFDSSGDGFLETANLRELLLTMIPSLKSLKNLPSSMKEQYLIFATSKFNFFLGGRKCGKISIVKLATSSVLEELMELRDSNIASEEVEKNWFSFENFDSVLESFVRLLDTKSDFFLSINDIAAKTSNFSLTFLNRLFEIYGDPCKGLDFEQFLYLQIAIANISHPASISYFFRLLDTQDKGYLDRTDLRFFFDDIRSYNDGKIKSGNIAPLNFESFCDAIFDMIQTPCRNEKSLSLQELINSGNADTLILTLIDTSFFDYNDTFDIGPRIR